MRMINRHAGSVIQKIYLFDQSHSSAIFRSCNLLRNCAFGKTVPCDTGNNQGGVVSTIGFFINLLMTW